MMKNLSKIIVYSIAIGSILFVVLCFIAIHLMGFNVAERKNRDIANRDEIIERIDSFMSINRCLPKTLSCIGFEQSLGGYEYKGILFDYIRLNDTEYLIEYTSFGGIRTQYINTEHRWIEEPNICYVEMPENAENIAAINRIAKFEHNCNTLPIIDSTRYNKSNICPISDISQIPDSIAYIKYLYANGSIRCEGWIAYFNDPEDDFSNPFGIWKYYDEQGNCFRKFWNYKENGKLIYETDR